MCESVASSSMKHLTRDSLSEIWANFQRGWQDPRVRCFIEELAADSHKTASLHQWVYL